MCLKSCHENPSSRYQEAETITGVSTTLVPSLFLHTSTERAEGMMHSSKFPINRFLSHLVHISE